MFLLQGQELPLSLYGQFHTDTKVFFALQGEWACFDPPSQCAHPLSQAGQSQTGTSRTFRLISTASIAQHLDTGLSVLVDHSNVTLPRSAVPDDVGHPFAHRPGECCVYGWWEHLLDGVDLYIDPGGGEELLRSPQLARKIRLPVASHRLTHLTQRVPRHALNLREFLHAAVGFLRDQLPRQFALEGDHGQGLTQEIMQVP